MNKCNDMKYVKFYNTVDKIIKSNILSHAYLIELSDFDEDYKFILNFIKLILCRENEKCINKLNCGKCNICKLIDDNNYIDLKVIEAEGNTIKKKQLVDLQNEFKKKSFLNNKLIYIIKDTDKLNEFSANTILKFLEEPQDGIIAILLTKNRFNILDTILSRCQVLSLSTSDVTYDCDDDLLFLTECIVKKDYLFINYKKLITSSLNDKEQAKKYLSQVQLIFINYLNYINRDNIDIPIDALNILCKIDSSFFVKYIAIIEEELNKLNFNVNYKLWLDSLFARLIGV